MDYGYQLLRHVLQQVFGNLREAAQLTLFLFLAPFAAFLALGLDTLAMGGAVEPEEIGGIVGSVFLIFVAGHRLLLLGRRRVAPLCADRGTGQRVPASFTGA
jgi:hypothetical protein